MKTAICKVSNNKNEIKKYLIFLISFQLLKIHIGVINVVNKTK